MVSEEKFVRDFEDRVKNTIKEYKLLKKEERIIVACSGGKDSTTVLYLLNKFGYCVEGLNIDLLIGEWSKKNLENIKKFCDSQKVKLNVVSTRDTLGGSMCFIRSGIQSKASLKNCSICGVIKRWMLNKSARKLKADKIVTGHNLDDEIETILMNFFQGDLKLSANLGPTSGVVNDKKFVQRVKPLYFCSNEEIKKYSEIKGFPVLYEPCPCSSTAFRGDVRKMIKNLEKDFPGIKENIALNFLNVLTSIKNKYKNTQKVNYCDSCGEPSRGLICKTCSLLKLSK